MNRPRSSQPAFRIAFITTLTFVGLAALGTTARALPADVVISQVYGGNGTTYMNDYIELHNRGTSTVSLVNWSVQVETAPGSWSSTQLNGTLPAGGYYLVREAGASGGAPLPTPNALGLINLNATSGKVALVNTTTNLSGTCPTGPSIVDFLGYGSVGCAEGSPMATLSTTTAGLRNDFGCTDTDDNSADFTAGAPNPRNTLTLVYRCPVTLTYLYGSHGSVSGPTPQTVPYLGDGSAVTPVPDAGYHFVKWTPDDRTDDPRTDLDVTDHLTVTATFAINQYTLTYSHDANGTISGDTPQTVDHGADGAAVTAVPNTGYHFVKWSDDNTANPRVDENVAADVSVTAEFAIDRFTLEYTAGDHGTLTGDSPQTVDYGADGTAVTAVPDAGYHFVKWSDDVTANPRTDQNVTASIDVTASFSIDQYALSVTIAPPSSGSVAPPSGLYDLGTNLNLIPTAEPGYHFDHWTGDILSGASPLPVTMNASVTLTAHFVPNDAASELVISQIWGSGGDNPTGYRNDYVELYNRGNGAAHVDGWTIQFAQAGSAVWNASSLFGVVPPGKYLLLQLYGAGGGDTDDLGDVTGAIDLNPTHGKVALVTNGTLLNTACPSGGGIIDFVGYGDVDCSESSPAGPISVGTAIFRGNGGCDETDHNNADFAGNDPAPRNGSHAAHFCALWTDVEPAPAAMSLALAGTNPVRGHARFALGLPSEGPVRLTISDVQGRRIASIANENLPAGRHEFAWDGSGEAGPVGAGFYYVTLQAMGRRVVRSFVLMR